MKRNSVILTAALALSAAAASAAGFSDVPASHWACEAVNKLTAKGIIQGYPNGTFRGENSVTRYHLATVVAKLLSNVEMMMENGVGGNFVTKDDLQTLEKLTVEFADELALLGVKVTAIEDDTQIVKEDVANLKSDVDGIKKFIANGGTERVTISGDMLVRHDDQLEGNRKWGNDGQNTAAAFRLKFNAKVDENVEAVVRTVLYSDNFGSQLGGATDGDRAGAKGAGYELNKERSEVDVAYVNIKDMFGFGGDFKFGRDFLTHGSALVISDYVDAVSYSKQMGKIKTNLNVIYDDQPNGMALPDKTKQILNLNFDTNLNGHNVYVGLYNQNFKESVAANPLRMDTKTYAEIGSKGTLGNTGNFGYEIGYAMGKTEYIAGSDLSGAMIHAAGTWDSHEEWALKLAFTEGNDEWNGAISRDYTQRSYDGVETPFDDIAFINGGQYRNMNDATLFKVQGEFRPVNSKHYFRFAYDMYARDIAAVGLTPAMEDEAGVMTFEYRWQMAENTRLRAGYQTLDGDKLSKDVDDDRCYIELLGKF